MYFLSYNCFSGTRESAAEFAAKLTLVILCVLLPQITVESNFLA